MKVTIDSDVLVYAFIEPTKKTYKDNYEDFILITGDRRFFHNVREHHPELKVHFLREMIDDLRQQ